MKAATAQAGELRAELERRLGAIGIETTRHWQEPLPDADRESRVRRFRDLLPDLGPYFARFGLYLSSRLDRLPAEDCLELARIEDRRVALPIDEVRRTLHQALARNSASMPSPDPEPLTSRLLHQCHSGRLPDGRLVRIKILRDEGNREGLDDLPDLLSGLGWSPSHLRVLVRDFHRLSEREGDLAQEETTLRNLSRISRDGQRFAVAEVILDASTAGIMTVSAIETRASAAPRRQVRDLADLWLHLLFEGRLIPERLTEDDLELTANRDLRIGGGLFHTVDRATSEALARYLGAATANDPEATFDALSELTESTDAARPRELRHRLRHVVPRRDGRFGPEPPGLPELLLAHWSESVRHGLEPVPALLAFYRGIVNLRELAGPSLSRGVLREAIQVRQIRRGAERFREMLPPPWLPAGAEAIVERWIDRSLDSKRPPESETKPEPTPPMSIGLWTHLAVYLLLSATVVLWSYRFAEGAGQAGGWIAAIALLLLSLRALWRR